jgi:2-amino-4-hydroxy-6-hydroxymethyldihydropteridine diphosphokinase
VDRSPTRRSSSNERPMTESARDIAYIALGSNLGVRPAYLARAREAIAGIPETRIIAESTVEETAAIGPIEQGPYLNQMVAVETSLAPRDLLAALHTIEAREGRVRTERWGPRTLDLDIVRFERQTIDEPSLRIPHPELPNREFW